MGPRYSGMNATSKGVDNVGIISIGAIEEKIPFILHAFLSSFDIVLCIRKNFDYPEDPSTGIIGEIKLLLHTEKLKGVVFDIRVRDWTNPKVLKQSRDLSLSLRNVCSDFAINSSVILSNGRRLFGNAVGGAYEIAEAREVLWGRGPKDLTKFALEIGADFLMMTHRVRQRIEAKKWLRDKIVKGEFLYKDEINFSHASLFSVPIEKIKVFSPRKGYVHNLSMNAIHSLKSELASAHAGLGFFLIKKTGDWIETGDALVEVYLPKGQKNPLEEEAYEKAFILSTDPPGHQPFILEKFEVQLHP